MECKCETCVRKDCADRTKQDDLRMVIACSDYWNTERQMTNADRIRAMDDELLAAQLTQIFYEGVTAITEKEIPDNLLNEVRAQILEKLKQPAEGDA